MPGVRPMRPGARPRTGEAHADLQGTRRGRDVPRQRRLSSRALQQFAWLRGSLARSRRGGPRGGGEVLRRGLEPAQSRRRRRGLHAPRRRQRHDAQRIQGSLSAAHRRRLDRHFGARGLPAVMTEIVNEFLCSANMAFAMYPLLTQGAISALYVHGSPEQKATYLPPMIAGKWTGTMNLTEAHCGTDLGQLRSKAVPQPDGSYRIIGTKIFISAGEHDLAENIVHLVLARIEGAPAGVKGISLF